MTEQKYVYKAQHLIDRNDPYIYGVASNLFPAQIVGNVKNTKTFLNMVAEKLQKDEEIKKNKKLKKVY
jgi:hypothetical protein